MGNGNNEGYKLRQKIGLFGGILLFFAILLLPIPQSMYKVAGTRALDQAPAEVLEAGAAVEVLALNEAGKVSVVTDMDGFLTWAKSEAPELYISVSKGAKAIRNCLAVMLLMIVWWVSESLPWAVPALLPAALFPILGVVKADQASAPYANKTIILFIAAFFIAQAMLKWNLHRRIAMRIVQKIGTSPRRIILGFMVACALLSMFISNTATAMMMMPMGLAVILHTAEVGRRLQKEGQLKTVNFSAGKYVFASCLMLGIAFSSNSGGMGTLIGTPPNMIFAGQLTTLFPGAPPVDFAGWLGLGMPLSIITTIVTWALLVYVLRRPEIDEIPGGAELIEEETSKLGPWNTGEKAVGIILLLTTLAWLFREEKLLGSITVPGLATIFPWIDDSTIAVLMAIMLFVIPISFEKKQFALTWDWALKIPWGIVLLFGGGFSLASALSASGAATWIASLLTGVSGMHLIVLMLIVALVVALFSTVATNTATATVFMPILGTMAVASAFDPRFLMILGALASQCAYALPVSTTGNAICFGSGYIDMIDMVKVGLVISAVSVLIVVFGSLLLLGPVFGVDPSIVPVWL